MHYTVVNHHETFGCQTEFDSLDAAKRFCDAERRDIGGEVHIYSMIEVVPGEWAYLGAPPCEIVVHRTA